MDLKALPVHFGISWTKPSASGVAGDDAGRCLGLEPTRVGVVLPVRQGTPPCFEQLLSELGDAGAAVGVLGVLLRVAAVGVVVPAPGVATVPAAGVAALPSA